MRITAWAEFTETDKERLILLVGSLDEFEAGIALGLEALKRVDPRHPAHSFFSNAVNQYLDGYFASPGSTGLLPVLRSIGRDDFADVLERALAEPVGESTVGAVLRTWRNKRIAHPTYRAHHVLDGLKDAQLATADNADYYKLNIAGLVEATREVRTLLLRAYPESGFLARLRSESPDH